MAGKLDVSKADTWIKQGAPAQALDFLGDAVTGLSQKAMKDNIIFKENKMAKKTVTEKEVEEELIVPETETEEEVPAEIADEDVTKETTPSTPSVNDSDTGPTTDTPATTPADTTPNTTGDSATMMKAFQDGVAEAIVVALKQYHTDIVVPMQAQIAELTAPSQEQVRKNFSMVENVFMNASDFMPAAAVSAMLKKEFGSDTETQAGDKVATEQEIDASATVVKEKQVTKSQGDDGNLLSGF